MFITTQKISHLPLCNQRVGRVWDNEKGKGRAIITCCGMHEVDLTICQLCGGNQLPLSKTYIEPKLIDYS